MRTVLLALVSCSIACTPSDQGEVRYPAYARGGAATFQAGAWQGSLELAQVALGPIYFCATEAASMSLCPIALNEVLQVTTVDALAPAAQPIGLVEGTTGTIGSVTYDLGITWFPRQRAPTPAPETPGGHSVRLMGSASDGSRSLRFVADLDIAPAYAGTLAVQGTRARAAITKSTQQLDVALDPGRWLAAVDFEELAAIATDPVVVEPGSRAASALVQAITAAAPPSFTWTDATR